MSKRFYIAVLAVLIVLSMALVACDVFGGSDTDTTASPTVYSVSFDPCGGSNVVLQTVEEGRLVTEPETPTRDTYVFDGWYKDSSFVTKWNFATDKVYSNMTLYAKWVQPVAVETNDDEGGSVSMRSSTSESGVVFLEAKTNKGYTFLGWFDGDTRVDENSTYKCHVTDENKTFTAKWFKLNIVGNREDAGSVSGLDKTYVVGSRASIKATINDGYVFIGWFNGETLLTRETTYDFTMPSESATYTAKWCKISVEKNISEAGTVGMYGDYSYFGGNATLKATKSTGYAFLGWFDGETKLTDDLTYSFTVTDEDKVYTAKYELCENHTFENCMCTKCGTRVHMSGDYCRHDNIAYFGSYPQTEVYDDATVATLNDLAGALPSVDDSKSWTSYDYYFNGSVKDIMWYIDIENAGVKYRGVYFSQVRSSFTAVNSVPNSAQSANNYDKNTVYWFKYEPIQWKILKEEDGKAFLLAEIALDSQNYYTSDQSHEVDGATVGANNYQHSTIRAWLNDTFYEMAFNDVQKQMLRTTKVDNGASSTGIANNANACDNTRDKVFLLSYQEATTYLTSNDNRIRKSTDYALCQGCKASTERGYMGNCYWWTRSPADNISTTVRVINDMGYATGNNAYVYATFYGVVPAVWVAWDGSEEKCEHVLDDKCVCTECGETLHELNDNCVCKGCGETFHTLDEDCVCEKCHEQIHMTKGYCRHTDYDSEDGREIIYFGTYPQSKVTDSNELSVLNSIAGKPSTNSKWISYGYYIQSEVKNYMWYIDVESMEAKYRGVYFTSYRPNSTLDASDWLTAYQYDNGYRTNTVYWFKYEPIKWQILDEKDGNVFLFATLVLDSREFKAGYNNYAESTIRAWLNETFYNTAFSALQKELILTTNVDNSTLSTSSTVGEDRENADVCDDTQDKVFLLSAQEHAIYLSEASEARRKGTDYAMCQGVHAAISNGTTTYSETLEGNCYWLMRSPSGFNGYVAICDYKGDRVNTLAQESCNGTVPALWIKL